jgi:hypothetical protein
VGRNRVRSVVWRGMAWRCVIIRGETFVNGSMWLIKSFILTPYGPSTNISTSAYVPDDVMAFSAQGRRKKRREDKGWLGQERVGVSKVDRGGK